MKRKRESFLFLVVRVVLWSDAVDLHSPPAILPFFFSASRVLFFLCILHRSSILASLLHLILIPIRRTAAAYTSSLKKTRRVAGISDTLRHNRKCRGNAITCRKKQIYGCGWKKDEETKGEMYERKRVGGRGRGTKRTLQRKAIATKSFSSQSRHVHVVGIFSTPYPAYRTYSRWHTREMRHETRCMFQKQDTFHEWLGFCFSINWALLSSVHAGDRSVLLLGWRKIDYITQAYCEMFLYLFSLFVFSKCKITGWVYRYVNLIRIMYVFYMGSSLLYIKRWIFTILLIKGKKLQRLKIAAF